MARPSIDDLTGDHELAKLARETWLTGSGNAPVRPQIVEQIWQHVESSGYSNFELLLLEQLQTLERYLWPGYNEDASNQHVLLLALLCNTKRREHLPVWPGFASRLDEFTDFFSRVAHLVLDTALATPLRTHLLGFVVAAFQSLDHGIVRKECAPLVSIAVWQHLHSDKTRELLFAQNLRLQKAWSASGKKYDSAEGPVQARLRFERSWLYTLVLQFIDKVYRPDDLSANQKQDDLLFCERLLELLCDIQSQLPTRRYVNTLLKDMNLLPALLLSPMYRTEQSIRDLYKLLQHYTDFPVDDHSGHQLSRQEFEESQNAAVSRLQKTALKLQPEKLKILMLANFSSLMQRDEVGGHLEDLTDAEMLELCKETGLRTTEYPSKSLVIQDRTFLLECLLAVIEKKVIYTDRMRELPILPTDATLYDSSLLHTDDYDGSRPLAIPRLNLQYLTIGDFLWRAFTLYRLESLFELRRHVEDVVKRLQPRQQNNVLRFDGFSRMAIPIAKPAIVDTLPPKVGEVVPAEVKSEVILDVSRLQPGLRKEWEQLRPGDVVYLVAVEPNSNADTKPVNGHSSKPSAQSHGIKALRCAEVVHVLDGAGKPLRFTATDENRPRQRRLILRLDTAAYKADQDRRNSGRGDIYEDINLIIRRKARENNFKPVLESIKQLTLTETPIPSWFTEVFLGFGDPSAASYKRLANRLKSVDYRDTFVDWQHLIESLPGKTLEPDPTQDSSFAPPYILESEGVSLPTAPRKGKKRRHDQPDGPNQASLVETVKVSSYKPANTGPYIADAPKLNSVRFTPTQIEAVTSGTQPGLTLIVGPPGTGKTDVATQIISNVYHNFPNQRTLLIAHSNQALNQLFQKIVSLDIDERHLLRLGHGEEDLETSANFSKAGRVDSFLERGAQYLAQVQRLAESIDAPGAHGSSCETADYFDQVYIKPRWRQFKDLVSGAGDDGSVVSRAFPFHAFFADAPQPLFPPQASKKELIEIADGCERHVRRIFDELADIRPFEILRAQRDKANYLLVKEARIIAMTSTHAAMRRQEIASLGFHYDNIVMEEAAQVTEIENFIPLIMQNPDSSDPSKHQLQRIILVGDHLQNSPVIQHPAAKSFSNLDQSLFQRLIRLGAPHVLLDAQGRSRPSLSRLYAWRYPQLTNLPLVTTHPAFLTANPGLLHTAQWIEVPDYKSRGETSPAPHIYQNLGEAEYAVALYMYMRLLGYPASSIAILSMYAGQAALIRDVLNRRCKSSPLFGLPSWTGTVDKFQGEQSDYVLLSMVRTKGIGYLRDVRRLTVALSRARLGLYVFGRRAIFEMGMETREAFGALWGITAEDTPGDGEAGRDVLQIVAGETFPTSRLVEDREVEGVTPMHGVEHLGQYVFEMTKAKMLQIEQEKGGMMMMGSEMELPDRRASGMVVDEQDAEDGEEEGLPLEEEAAGEE
jgi:intron-binding protein aquarius